MEARKEMCLKIKNSEKKARDKDQIIYHFTINNDKKCCFCCVRL